MPTIPLHQLTQLKQQITEACQEAYALGAIHADLSEGRFRRDTAKPQRYKNSKRGAPQNGKPKNEARLAAALSIAATPAPGSVYATGLSDARRAHGEGFEE